MKEAVLDLLSFLLKCFPQVKREKGSETRSKACSAALPAGQSKCEKRVGWVSDRMPIPSCK